ncbi:hypothetical protein GGF31_004843 [Allomyces arbusculus]|nr:hypothetical protein GGF31_004843 [Allomyces arbusculus]
MSFSHSPHAPDARFPPPTVAASANDDDGATLVDNAVRGPATDNDSVGLALFSPAAIDMWWWTGTMPDDAFASLMPDWLPNAAHQPAFFPPPTHAFHDTGGAHAAHAAVEPTLSAGHSPPWIAASSSNSSGNTMGFMPGGPLALATAAPTVVNVFRSAAAAGGGAPTLCLDPALLVKQQPTAASTTPTARTTSSTAAASAAAPPPPAPSPFRAPRSLHRHASNRAHPPPPPSPPLPPARPAALRHPLLGDAMLLKDTAFPDRGGARSRSHSMSPSAPRTDAHGAQLDLVPSADDRDRPHPAYLHPHHHHRTRARTHSGPLTSVAVAAELAPASVDDAMQSRPRRYRRHPCAAAAGTGDGAAIDDEEELDDDGDSEYVDQACVGLLDTDDEDGEDAMSADEDEDTPPRPRRRPRPRARTTSGTGGGGGGKLTTATLPSSASAALAASLSAARESSLSTSYSPPGSAPLSRSASNASSSSSASTSHASVPRASATRPAPPPPPPPAAPAAAGAAAAAIPDRINLHWRVEFAQDFSTVTRHWTAREKTHLKRRLVTLHVARDPVRGKISVSYTLTAPQNVDPRAITVSCIYWARANAYFLTSVDFIYAMENILAAPFSVEEKNRIRRNMETFRPITVAKGRAESADFFRTIMQFGDPKPRKIEKDVKVFRWDIFPDAIRKIVEKWNSRNTLVYTLSADDHQHLEHLRMHGDVAPDDAEPVDGADEPVIYLPDMGDQDDEDGDLSDIDERMSMRSTSVASSLINQPLVAHAAGAFAGSPDPRDELHPWTPAPTSPVGEDRAPSVRAAAPSPAPMVVTPLSMSALRGSAPASSADTSPMVARGLPAAVATALPLPTVVEGVSMAPPPFALPRPEELGMTDQSLANLAGIPLADVGRARQMPLPPAPPAPVQANNTSPALAQAMSPLQSIMPGWTTTRTATPLHSPAAPTPTVASARARTATFPLDAASWQFMMGRAAAEVAAAPPMFAHGNALLDALSVPMSLGAQMAAGDPAATAAALFASAPSMLDYAGACLGVQEFTATGNDVQHTQQQRMYDAFLTSPPDTLPLSAALGGGSGSGSGSGASDPERMDTDQ